MARKPRPRSRAWNAWVGALLWVLAVVLMFAAAGYQRRTGPTYPVQGSFELGGRSHAYELLRSHATTSGAPVSVPDPGEGATARLWFKRFGTEDPFAPLPMRPEEGSLAGALPAQPPAGKLEYFVRLRTAVGDEVRIPEVETGSVVLRYKGEVPAAVLIAHVLAMFLSMLVGIRAALAALAGRAETRRLAWVALVLMTAGGLILGPIVQEYAFGQFWTGFPFGYDLTDNKLLIMWLVWVAACAVLGRRVGRREAAGRVAVLAAATIMIVVFLIPHSLRGSTLDYEKLDRGVAPEEAIETG